MRAWRRTREFFLRRHFPGPWWKHRELPGPLPHPAPGGRSVRCASSWPVRIVICNLSFVHIQLLIACRSRAAFNRPKHLRRDLLNWLISVDVAQASLLLVILFQRLGLALIAFQTLRYNLFRIVNALEQLGAADVANAFSFGRLEIDVVNLAVDRTSTAACKPLQ